MKTLIIVLLILWLVVSVVGAVVEGLLWLVGVGLLLLAVTAVYGWIKLRSRV